MGRLSGKVALITGASGGQGAEEAKLFAQEGAKVVLADVNKEGLDALVEEITSRGLEALAVVLDVSSTEQWSDAIRQVDERYGRLDVLVNNAGIMAFGGVVETEVQAWNRTISINQTGPWLGMKYSVPLMRKSGNGGSIINLSSIYGIIGANGAVGYQGTKAAIRGISRSAAIELAADRIRVNTVMPGFIDSPMTARVLEEQGLNHPDIVNTPLKRPGLPIEIAYGVLYLASDEASFITGAEIVIDGGLTAW